MRSRGRSSTSTSPSAWAKASRAREARSFMISLVSRRRAISAWMRSSCRAERASIRSGVRPAE